MSNIGYHTLAHRCPGPKTCGMHAHHLMLRGFQHPPCLSWSGSLQLGETTHFEDILGLDLQVEGFGPDQVSLEAHMSFHPCSAQIRMRKLNLHTPNTKHPRCDPQLKGSIYAACALRATFTAGLPGMGWLLPPHKMPPKRANPWVQNLCKHPSILPYPAYPAPRKVKVHKMAPLEHPPFQSGLSIFPTLVQISEGNYSSSGLATS